MPVQRNPRPVVPDGGARVGVQCGFLHVAQRDADIEGRSDERVPQRVRPDFLREAGAPADDPPGAVSVQPLPGGGGEYRA
jgi:hypothetical protein